VSRLVKASVIPGLTFVLEIYTQAHINEDKLAPIRICLRMAAQITTGGWKKSDLKALGAELASLPSSSSPNEQPSRPVPE